MTPSRMLRKAKLIQALPAPTNAQKTVTRRSRSHSPGNVVGLRTKRARLEKEKEKDKTPSSTPKTSASVESTPKSSAASNLDESIDGTPVSDGIPTPQSSQNTPKSHVAITPGSAAKQHVAGTPGNTPKGQVAGTPGSTPGSTPKIRTRLATGSIQMNGTMTISAKQEKAELEQIMKQISKSDTPPSKTTPTGLKKRHSQSLMTPHDGLSADHPPPKKRKIGRNNGSGEDNENDYFCWLCHKEGTLVCCELCPRVYHTKCLGLSAALPQAWVCPECEKIMRAECVDTRSKSMEMLTIEQLCTLLKYALDRMKHSGSEPFHKPVDQNAVPNYSDYIFHPMDLSTLEKNIKQKMYGCTEALLADAKWILHNCIIYNGAHNKLTTSAKMIIKICKHEMNEIELCPDCYLNSCVRKNDEWFSETCRVPHTLVWAKLKGYPFWPSKALREVDGQVDVRFFGAHDRSWVPVSQCFLLSKNIPTSLHGKKNNGLDMAIEELNLHVNKLREKFGTFEYAPFRTPYDKTDTYKPFTIKPDTAVKPLSNWPTSENSPAKPSLTSPRKINSNMSGPQSIIRRSAITKTASALKNKYSALVSLKKLDITTETAKTAVPLSGKSSVQATDVHIKEMSEETVKEKNKPESLGVIKSDNVETKRGEINKTGTAADNQSAGIEKKDKVTVKKSPVSLASKAEVGTPDKGIKKTYVSSSLIERLESKLKALDADKTEVSDDSKSENDKNSDPECAVIEGRNDGPESKGDGSVKEGDELKNSDEEKKSNELIKEESGNEHHKSTSDSKASTENVDTGKVKTDSVPDQSDSKADDEKTTSEEEFVKELNDIGKESKDSYRKKLESMIKSCKEKLGIENNGLEEIDSILSDIDESSDEDNDDSDDDSSGSEGEKEEMSKDKLDESKSAESKKSHDTVNKSTDETEEIGSNSAEERMENENNSVDFCKDNTKEIHEEIKDNAEKDGEVPTSEGASTVDKSEKPEEINESKEEELVLPENEEQQSKTKSQDASIASEVVENSKSNQLPKPDVINLGDIDKMKEPVVVNEVVKSTPEPVVGENVKSVTENDVVNEESPSDKMLDPVSGIFSDRTLEDEDSDVDRLVIDLEDETLDISDSRKVNQSELNRTKIDKEVNKSKSTEKKDKTVEIISDSSSSSPKIFNKSGKRSEMRDAGSGKLGKTSSGRKLEKRGKSIMTPSPKDKNKVRKITVAEQYRENSFKSLVKTTSTPTVKSPVIKQRTESGDSVSRLQKELSEDVQVSENTPSSKDEEENDEVIDDDVMEIIEEPIIGLIHDFSEQRLDLNSCLPDKNFTKPPVTSAEVVSESQSASKLAEKFSKKLLETIQKTMDEMCTEVLKEKSEGNTREVLSEQLAQAKWNYCAELNELKHNFQLTLYEMKAGWESEKEMLLKGLGAKLNAEKELAIKETKKKQWCAQCGKEAIFYCCWNTSYCDYPCQQNHWPQHMHSCLQTNKDKTSNTSTSGSTGSQSQSVSQSPVSIPVSIGPILNPSTSIPVSSASSDIDHLRRLQENLNAAMQRKEEERGESRPGVSPKFTTPMTSAAMQNIRQTGPQTIPMFNMQSPPNTHMMQQFQRARFIGQQQMMSVQQRGNLPASQQINPRMVFSQPLVQQTIYPVQVAQQQQLGGAILFQNPQQNLMAYGMPPRPY